MILKGNQRAGGADLATHLLNAFDNERVEIAEVRGTVARDLLGAFSEYEAVACGTRCRQPLYSLSINPSAPITRQQYSAAIARIEDRLGLAGQPRAIVFHVKHGREHCHVVWSRIKVRVLRAVPMSHDHNKLRALARELALEFGLELPPGLRFDRGPARFAAPPAMTLAEKSQAEESGITPGQRRADITRAWRQSDSAEAFRAALQAGGYTLAQGDRRGFVVVDTFGHIHSLARCIDGAKTKDIRLRLSPLAPDQLPEAKAVQAAHKERQQAVCEAERTAGMTAQRQKATEKLKAMQRQRRLTVESEQQALLVRHAADRMTLHAAQKSEFDALARQRAAADAKPISAILAVVPGYALMVRYLRRWQDRALARRHDEQSRFLRLRHDYERLDLARKFRALRKVEAREQRSLEKHYDRVERQQRRAARATARQAEIVGNARDITAAVKAPSAHAAGKTRQNRGGKALKPARLGLGF